MTKKYNAAHLIYTFKIRDIVTVAILANNQVVNDAPRMEAYITDILYKNWYTLQTKYGILTNSYFTSEFN